MCYTENVLTLECRGDPARENGTMIPKSIYRRLSQTPFRLAFIWAYAFVVGTLIIYLNLMQRDNWPFTVLSAWRMGGILLLLVGVDYMSYRVEMRRETRGDRMSTLAVFVLVRIVLLELFALSDLSGLSIILYPIVPFAAYFAISPQLSNLVGAIYMVVSIWKYQTPFFPGNAEMGLLTNLVIFAMLLIFTQIAARIIERDERSQQQSQKLLAELAESNRKLRLYAETAGELAAAEERNRLARDIHDTLGHYLTAVNIQLEKALVFQQRNPDEAIRALREAKDAAAEALQDVRRSVGTLRDGNDMFSLQNSLADLVSGMQNGTLSVELIIAGDEVGYSRPVLMTLYRVAQEGLTNIRKHALAGHARLNIKLGPEQATLALCDDGQGFDLGELDQRRRDPGRNHFGLQGIRERVELVSGKMVLRSRPKEGTELLVTVPKNPIRIATSEWLNLPAAEVKQL
jgi:signal transduction histidine kinase